MLKFAELTKRNLKIYFRDTGALFFSLLSMLIVILLMAFFLGDMNVDSVTNLLSAFPGRDVAADEKNAEAAPVPVPGASYTRPVRSALLPLRFCRQLRCPHPLLQRRALV